MKLITLELDVILVGVRRRDTTPWRTLKVRKKAGKEGLLNVTHKTIAAALIALAMAVTPASAQDTCPCPEKPEPGWRTSIGLGFAYTTGNTDAQNLNLTFDAVHDPKTKNVFKASGLWIRNETDGEVSANRAAGEPIRLARDES